MRIYEILFITAALYCVTSDIINVSMDSPFSIV